MHHITIESPAKKYRFSLGNDLPLVVIAGPCAIESREQTLDAAEKLASIFSDCEIPFLFKSSFDKANRSSLSSYRGVGIDEGLSILAEVRERFDLPVVTDIHSIDQAERVAAVADCLQIPAFLCRQTDLLLAAAATGKPVNVKKGQFLAPWEMRHVAEKTQRTGNRNILLCERGTSFGYNNLIVDMRSLAILKDLDLPVVFDATHSVQLPGAAGGKSGGQREFVPVLARAAVAIGIAVLFIETHENPDKAPCDGPNMLPFSALPRFLRELKVFDAYAKSLVADLPNP